jgi:hypothetical protein
MIVYIVKLTRGFDIFEWLCDPCLEKRVADGFRVLTKVEPGHEGLHCLYCDVRGTR